MPIDSQNQWSTNMSPDQGAKPAQKSAPKSDSVTQGAQPPQSSLSQVENAFDLLRGSVVHALDSVVREYEPQIADFTSSIAHQAVDRGVSFAQTTVQRIQKQSWLRLGLAAALGVGVIAVLSYEAVEAAKGDKIPLRTTH